MEKPYPYTLAKLHEYSSLADPWHVVYYIWSEKKGRLVRRRVSFSEPTPEARRKAAKPVIKDINALLKEGAIIEPLEPEKSTPADSLMVKEAEPSLLEITERSKITDAIEYFLAKKKRVLAPGTYSSYSTDLKRFKTYLLENDFEKIKLKDFQKKHAYHFMDTIHGEGDEDISNRSINNNKDTCSNLFNFFVKREIITKNPFSDIEDLPSQAKRHTAFTQTQELTFIKECIKQKEWQLLLFILMVRYMALRPGEEARLLRVRDVKETTIRVLSETAKGKISEHVQIPQEFEKILQTYNIRQYDEDLYVFSIDGKPGKEKLSKKFFYKKHFLILEKLKMLG
ncbi:MAG: site-specific integrase, partial [Leadbetterella sp.]|nr:site-specific integrase [Leadbetterella sp.]